MTWETRLHQLLPDEMGPQLVLNLMGDVQLYLVKVSHILNIHYTTFEYHFSFLVTNNAYSLRSVVGGISRKVFSLAT